MGPLAYLVIIASITILLLVFCYVWPILAINLCRKFNSTRQLFQNHRKLKHWFISAISFFGIITLYTQYISFYTSRGHSDFYRIPLEKPYQLTSIDGIETFAIGKWQRSRSLISRIYKVSKENGVIIGIARQKAKGQPIYFTFSPSTGALSQCSTQKEFKKLLTSHSISSFNLQSPEEYWKAHWQ